MSTPAPEQAQPGSLSNVGELFGEITGDISTLVRQEIALAKAEARQSAVNAGKGAGMFGGAAVAGHFVLLFLSVALWWGLGNSIGRGWSGLVVAALWAVIATALVVVGRKNLKDVKGMSRTVATTKQIPNALKGDEDRNE